MSSYVTFDEDSPMWAEMVASSTPANGPTLIVRPVAVVPRPVTQGEPLLATGCLCQFL